MQPTGNLAKCRREDQVPGSWCLVFPIFGFFHLKDRRMDKGMLLGSANTGLGVKQESQYRESSIFLAVSVQEPLSPHLPEVSPTIAGVPRQGLVWPVLPSGTKCLLISPSLGIKAGTALLGPGKDVPAPVRDAGVEGTHPGCSLPSRPSCWSPWSLRKLLELFTSSCRTTGTPVQALCDPRQSLSLTFLVSPTDAHSAASAPLPPSLFAVVFQGLAVH